MVAPSPDQPQGDGDAANVNWRREDWTFNPRELTAAPRTSPHQPQVGEKEEKCSGDARSSCRKSLPRPTATCQVDNCSASEADGPFRWKRCRICDHHAQAPYVLAKGEYQRFCQLCKRLHPLSKFSGTNRSCSEKLREHSRRRREKNRRSSERTAASQANATCENTTNAPDEAKVPASSDKESDKMFTWQHGFGAPAIPQVHNGMLEAMQAAFMNLNGFPHQVAPERCQCVQNPVPLHLSPAMAMLARISPTRQYQPWHPTQKDEVAAGISPGAGECRSCEGTCAKHQGSPYPQMPQPMVSPCPTVSKQTCEAEMRTPKAVGGGSINDGADRLCRAVFKLYGRSPNDLPPNLLTQVLHMIQTSPQYMMGYINPGCVELTLDMLLPLEKSKVVCKELAERLVRLQTFHSDVWRNGKFSLQVNAEHVTVEGGRVKGKEDCQHSESVPELEAISPLCMQLNEKREVRVYGRNLEEGARASITREGRCYVMPVQEEMTEDGCLNIELEAVTPGSNLLQLTSSNGFASNIVPILVVEDGNVCREIRQVEELFAFSHRGSETLLSNLFQLGRALAHGSEAVSEASLREMMSFASKYGMTSVHAHLNHLRNAKCMPSAGEQRHAKACGVEVATVIGASASGRTT